MQRLFRPLRQKPNHFKSNAISSNEIYLFVESLESRLLLTEVFGFAADYSSETNDDFAIGNAVAFDSSGSVYSAGIFSGTVDFDASENQSSLTGNNRDAFVTKHDGAGNLLWAIQFTGSGNLEGNDIIVDHQNNVIVVGTISGQGDFDPGSDDYILEDATGTSGFVAKLDSSGNLIWAALTGTGDIHFAEDVAVDQSGNIFTSGYFYRTVDFDPSTATFNLTAQGSTVDGFISKLDPDGNFVHAWAISGSASDVISSITVDQSNNVIVTGDFWYTADFDPSGLEHNLTSSGSNEIFVAKYSNDGDLIWAHAFGSIWIDRGLAVATGPDNSIVVTGHFNETADFDPGPGEDLHVSEGASQDMFVVKFSSEGIYQWAATPDLDIESVSGTAEGTGIGIDQAGIIYTVGKFSRAVDFDPGTNVEIVDGTKDIFIQKLSSQGTFLGLQTVGSSGSENVNGFALNQTSFAIAGSFRSTVDFDPSANVFELTSEFNDGFVLRIDKDFIVPGTTLADQFSVVVELDRITATVNGQSYSAPLIDGRVIRLLVDGRGGDDSITITGNSDHETVVLSPLTLSMIGDRYRLDGVDFEQIQVNSGSPNGDDLVTFLDSSNNDLFTGDDGYGKMTGPGYHNEAFDFGVVVARSVRGGDDTSTLMDSDGNDLLVAYNTFSRFVTTNAVTKVYFFSEVNVYASNGLDTSRFYDSPGNEQFIVSFGDGRMVGDLFLNRAYNFDRMIGYSNRGGNDEALIDDTNNDDTLIAGPTSSRLSSTGYLAQAIRFEKVIVNGSTGLNRAFFYDSSGSDIYQANRLFSQMSGDTFFNRANGFNYAYGYSTKGGIDQATIDDSIGNDLFVARHNVSFIRGDDFRRQVSGFQQVTMNASTGLDIGRMYDWTGDDTFFGDGNSANLFGDTFNNRISNLDKVLAYSINGGDDEMTTDNINYTLVPIGNWS